MISWYKKQPKIVEKKGREVEYSLYSPRNPICDQELSGINDSLLTVIVATHFSELSNRNADYFGTKWPGEMLSEYQQALCVGLDVSTIWTSSVLICIYLTN